MTVFPPAEYLVLSSRLVPGLDGGFTIATMQRARHMAAAGVDGGRGPWLMTVDPASHASHDAHRAEFVRLGLLEDPARLRNLCIRMNLHSTAFPFLTTTLSPAIHCGH